MIQRQNLTGFACEMAEQASVTGANGASWRYPEATLARDTDHAQVDAVARNHGSCWLSGAHANRQPTNGLGRSLGAIPQ